LIYTNKFYLHDTFVFMIYLYIFVENIYRKYIYILYIRCVNQFGASTFAHQTFFCVNRELDFAVDMMDS